MLRALEAAEPLLLSSPGSWAQLLGALWNRRGDQAGALQLPKTDWFSQSWGQEVVSSTEEQLSHPVRENYSETAVKLQFSCCLHPQFLFLFLEEINNILAFFLNLCVKAVFHVITCSIDPQINFISQTYVSHRCNLKKKRINKYPYLYFCLTMIYQSNDVLYFGDGVKNWRIIEQDTWLKAVSDFPCISFSSCCNLSHQVSINSEPVPSLNRRGKQLAGAFLSLLFLISSHMQLLNTIWPIFGYSALGETLLFKVILKHVFHAQNKYFWILSFTFSIFFHNILNQMCSSCS